MMYLVLCYDVTANARRNRLHKRLKGFLSPVQKSVFEGPVPSARWRALQQMLLDTIDPQVDVVRIYRLCGRCRIHTHYFGPSTLVDQETRDVIL